MSESVENSFIDTLKSLIVAFVLAMTFRAFVTEGFVIPTGSMAPTLLGQHVRVQSRQTGWEFAAGVMEGGDVSRAFKNMSDPMLGPQYNGTATSQLDVPKVRSGDRILVHKSLYPFSSPDRFDVVVFKNPTNPNGPDGNYIKRLVGLPNEAIWLVNGDVFVTDTDRADDHASYRVQRKPEHVQRAVWQPVHHSDFYPTNPTALNTVYPGCPWRGDDNWVTDETRGYRCGTAEPSYIEWENHIRQATDWAPYNQLGQRSLLSYSVYVSDLRIAATIVPDEDGLATTFELETNKHVYQYTLAGNEVTVRMRSSEWGDEFPDEGWTAASASIDPLRPGRPVNVEFWHVDQRLAVYLEGDLAVELPYEWQPLDRLHYSINQSIDDVDELALGDPRGAAQMTWRFEGSPVTLYRVSVDRDLFYRGPNQKDGANRVPPRAQRNPTAPNAPEGYAERVDAGHYGFGTHPGNIARLGPHHFFMLGDNSRASSDSRMWGNPNPIVATQIDPAPFVVHRSLLLGKAWVVYFPSPLPVSKGGNRIIPDFGRLRFIR